MEENDIVTELLLKEETSLKSTIIQLNSRLDDVQREIANRKKGKHLESISSKGSADASKDFPKNASMLIQLDYILTSLDRFLYNEEITSEIIKHRPAKDFKWLQKRVSSVLSGAKKSGAIEGLVNTQMSASIQDTVWGKKHQLNEDGSIKNQYLPKAKS